MRDPREEGAEMLRTIGREFEDEGLFRLADRLGQAAPSPSAQAALDLLDEMDRYSHTDPRYAGSPFEEKVLAFLAAHGRRSEFSTCLNGEHLYSEPAPSSVSAEPLTTLFRCPGCGYFETSESDAHLHCGVVLSLERIPVFSGRDLQAAQEEIERLRPEGDWLREQLRGVQHEMDQAREESAVRGEALRDLLLYVEECGGAEALADMFGISRPEATQHAREVLEAAGPLPRRFSEDKVQGLREALRNLAVAARGYVNDPEPQSVAYRCLQEAEEVALGILEAGEPNA